jgi:hypothetical protein
MATDAPSGKGNRAAATGIKDAASTAVASVGSAISQQADNLVSQAGDGVSALVDQIAQQLPQEGLWGQASQSFAHKVRDGGEYLQQEGLSGISDDLSELIKNNPLPAVLIALGIGWYIGRNI